VLPLAPGKFVLDELGSLPPSVPSRRASTRQARSSGPPDRSAGKAAPSRSGADEKLAYESDVGSKGYLSDIEKGLARPTVETLRAIAEHLEVDLLDLVTFPSRSERQELVDRTRKLTEGSIKRLLKEIRAGSQSREREA